MTTVMPTTKMADRIKLLCKTTLLFLSVTAVSSIRYEPNWKSIDSRPLPAWYDEAKIGIFIHWGVFSVPSIAPLQAEWFWQYWLDQKMPLIVNYMKDNFKPDFTYPDFAKDFTAEFYDPYQWAEIFNASGARYLVFTSKHHDGFTNWPSKYAYSWNSMDVGPNRDIVGELADAIRSTTSIKFGLYHSLFEWYNPLYEEDKKNNFTTNRFIRYKTMPELYEIVNTYKPEVIWSDGDWEAYDTYWNSTGFISWLYNDSPVKNTVVTNDRWGIGIACKHGGFLTCQDRYNPGTLQKRKWENAMTIDSNSWGFRRNANLSQMLTMEELIGTVVRTVSCGGNILINVGPTKDGRIVPIFEERLRSLGQWLKVNGEAIYGTKPWVYQNDTQTPNVWYTSKKVPSGSGLMVFATVLTWPDPGDFYLDCPIPTSATKVSLLGYPTSITWKPAQTAKGMFLEIPVIPYNHMPGDYAWVFTLSNLEL